MKYFVLILFFPFNAIAQINIGYFPLQSLIELNSNTNKRIFASTKIETNTFASNMNIEISAKLRLNNKPRHNFYIGSGISTNFVRYFINQDLLNGYFLDFGIRIKPIKDIPKLQFVFELSPYINTEFTSGNLRSRIGVFWFLSKKLEKN